MVVERRSVGLVVIRGGGGWLVGVLASGGGGERFNLGVG